MAIPTDFKGFTPSAGTTKTFKMLGSASVGLWVCDVDGTLSATTSYVPIGTNCILLFDQAYTDTQLASVLRDYLARLEGRTPGSGAGGFPADATKQVAVTATTTT